MNTVDNLPLFTPAQPWSGRDDGPGPENARWHSVVDTSGEEIRDSAAVIGFASDEGVLRNGGRQGAAAGPEALRGALGSLAIHHDIPRADAGTVCTQGDDLEGAQEELSNRVAGLIERGNLVVVLGGGHETAFASHRGLYRALGETTTGIVNLDAHFDLRNEDQATSGTPFLQIAQMRGESFNYHVLGISQPNNTRVLFDTAERLGVDTVLDHELIEGTPAEAAQRAAECCEGVEAVHLSIDLDALPATSAPGVSAPAGLGVPLIHIRAMVRAVAATGKLRLLDVVELNPRFDIDERTAKAAARLVDDAVVAALG